MDKFELKITPSSYTEERTYIENEFGEDVDCEPYQHTTNYVSAEIIINNQKIKSFVDYFALFYDVLDRGYTNPFWSEGQGTDSNFYPFTCSCGNAGCASIWNGIFSKHRKYTVEYRIKNKELNGYSFLPKSFYSFDKQEYINQIVNAWKYLNSLDKSFTDGFDHSSDLYETLSYIKEHKDYKGSVLGCL